MKKKPKYNQNSTIRGALRRAFARSPLVQEKMGESRREIPKFNKDGGRAKKNAVQRQCEVCQQWVGSTKIAIDHVDPVIPVSGAKTLEDGSQDWNDFIDRLWCNKAGKTNLQRICDTCHNTKTNAERITRLTKQYTEELDQYERTIRLASGMRNLIGGTTDDYRNLIKGINKYIAKKKTKGLELIVQRAKELKEKILEIKRRYDGKN